MSFEIDAVDADSYEDFAGWLKDVGLWDGRHVTIEEAPEFQKTIEARLSDLIHSMNPDSIEFERLGVLFATLGTAPEDQPLLARDIQVLRITSEWKVIPVGLRSCASKFWKDHKVAIIVGAGVFAVGVGIAVVYFCSGGTAALGTAACFALAASDQDEKPQSNSLPLPSSSPPQITETPKNLSLSDDPVWPSFDQTHHDYMQKLEPDLRFASQFKTGQSLPPVTFPQQEYFKNVWLEIFEPNPINVKIAGQGSSDESSNCQVGMINGMSTSYFDAASHASYLADFTPNGAVDLTYNRTNRVFDVPEIMFMNYLGSSPKTSGELQTKWNQFHEANKNEPNLKYLQICHSQGAIHVKNALRHLPKEIQNRVIVVAIAPGAVVPKEFCYMSYNYASNRDFVYMGEIASACAISQEEFSECPLIKEVFDHHKELIFLEPHEDATWLDHDAQSPTFKKVLSDIIEDYYEKKGVYVK